LPTPDWSCMPENNYYYKFTVLLDYGNESIFSICIKGPTMGLSGEYVHIWDIVSRHSVLKQFMELSGSNFSKRWMRFKMNFICYMAIWLSSVILPTLAVDHYYAVPIQQYVAGNQYASFETNQDNEMLHPNESSKFQYVTVLVEGDQSEDKYSDVDHTESNGMSRIDLEINKPEAGKELLETQEARNYDYYYYIPYVRYRQISRHRSRVPSRRQDFGSALNRYNDDYDRFPTVT
ncbi:hypothetical protein NQ315_010820, partial [Exocentrus adspersus]